MKYMIILFVVVFLFLYGGLNYYIGMRGWQHLGSTIPIINIKIYWILFWFIAVSYIAAQLLEKYLPAIISESLEVIGGYWLAIMFYLVLVLPAIDLIRLLGRRIKFLPAGMIQNEKTALVVAVTVVIALTTLMVYGTWSGKSPKVSTYKINISKMAGNLDKLKVVMVSDIHLGSIVDKARLSGMVERINELKPDIILMPGDIIDSKLEPFVVQNMGDEFKNLTARYGVYASLGNHEGISREVEETVKNFEDAGITVLRDKAILIENSFYVAGRDDNAVYRGSNTKRKELSEILAGLDKSKPVLFMNHQPKELETAEKEGIDLQVSGHTHRGQFFPNNLITSRIFELDFGYLKKGNLNLVVSSGFGTWGPPIRIGSRSEIVEIYLDFAN